VIQILVLLAFLNVPGIHLGLIHMQELMLRQEPIVVHVAQEEDHVSFLASEVTTEFLVQILDFAL